MIDFSKINPFELGQRSSFEELVCQLARYESFPEHSIYKRVDGAGGDGGVEAYWTKPCGRKTGYQAKFFLRSRDINWYQIDKSVKQALATHSELERYVIALPCDLTNKSGRKRRGKTGWDHWETWVKKWENYACSLGVKDLIIEIWTKNELNSRLIKNDSNGLRNYFFGDVQLVNQWFEDKLNETIVTLDERFHPEDHVNVRIEQLFSVISRNSIFTEELAATFNSIRNFSLPSKQHTLLAKTPKASIIRSFKTAYSELLEVEEHVYLDAQYPWNVSEWQTRINKLFEANKRLHDWYVKFYNTLDDAQSEKYTLHRIITKFQKINQSIGSLNDIVQSKYMDAELLRVAFVRGNAGSGKSHLLAKCATKAIANGQPTVLLLGQRFNDNDIWVQISQMLDLPSYSTEQVLGAIDAAGKSAGIRALLLIDAINEGIGCDFWRNQLARLIHKLQQYPHICCVISCRSEYFDLAIPQNISNKFPVFDIRGFESPSEQLSAARVYLDRRGIARPSTPWLSPEFVNPLFLRSICIALEREGKAEIPPGITGTKMIFTLYLDSIANNIARKEGYSYSLAPILNRAVHDVAKIMLEHKQDYLNIGDCRSVIAKLFQHVTPKSESDWLSVLLNNGVLRKDPNPSRNDDFLDMEVVRFSFQRYQDFLIAQQAVMNNSKKDKLFATKGPLRFCLENDNLSWNWIGVINALAIVLPEELNIELVDALPGKASKWWNKLIIRETFVESVQWRAREAFSDRTLELLNKLNHPSMNVFELLLRVAITSDHPWNAEILHRNLESRKLPDRDVLWTNWLNLQDEVDSSVGVIIEWSRVGQASSTNPENQILAAIVLCWFFTSSNRIIRDRSTKALANLLLCNHLIFQHLLPRFIKIDDLYVLERLLAAAFGSCCLDPNLTRLKKYSGLVYEYVFTSGHPPFGLQLRDYALGIIEIAEHYGSLPNCIDLSLCKPPYDSEVCQLTVTKKRLKNIATKAGNDQILRSTTCFMEDFAKYTIAPRIDRFLNIPLSVTIEPTSKQRAYLFKNNIVGQDRKRIQAYKRLEDALISYHSIFLPDSPAGICKNPTKVQLQKRENRIVDARNAFLALLDDNEVENFHKDAEPFLNRNHQSNPEPSKYNLKGATRWIAKRSYDYGWTQERFRNDNSRISNNFNERPKFERIGKKYQWLALDEMLSRISDNFWMVDNISEIEKVYTTPIDVGFVRDIDPTILSVEENHRKVTEKENAWAFTPWIKLQEVDHSDLTAWPFWDNPSIELGSLTIREDDDGTKWLVLHEYQSITDKYPDDEFMSHRMRLREFRTLATVMIHASDAQALASHFESKERFSLMNWAINDAISETYLFEAPWRTTWDTEKWKFACWELPAGIPYAQLTTQYVWESHLDAALLDGYSSYLPTVWLAKELNLKPDIDISGCWRNADDEIVFQVLKGNAGHITLLRKDVADKLVSEDYTFLSMLISERNAWPNRNFDNSTGRRTESVCWQFAKNTKVSVWKSDYGNSTSKC